MKINELAEETGLTPPTIRFYEKEGLLDSRHVQRKENNYRNYSFEDIKHLKMIKKFQSVGFSLDELKEIVQETAANKFTLKMAIELLRQKMLEVELKKNELNQIHRALEEMLVSKMTMMNELED